MSLKDRFINKKQENQAEFSDEECTLSPKDFSAIKENIYNLLSDKISSTPLWERYDSEKQNLMIKQFTENQLSTNFKKFTPAKKEKIKLVQEITDLINSYGPITELLENESISEILINGTQNIYVQKEEKFIPSDIKFTEDKNLISLAKRIIYKSGQNFDETKSIYEIKLKNGTCINIIMPPTALNGPYIRIKKANTQNLTTESLIQSGFMSKEIAEFLSEAVKAKFNIAICGEKFSGKTTLLNFLATQIPDVERTITIEKSPELNINKENFLSLISNFNSVIELLDSATNLHPERIILGDCNFTEALKLIQIINSGYKGSLFALLTNSAQTAILTLQNLLKTSESTLPENLVNFQITSAINLVIQTKIYKDGSRKIASVSEVSQTKDSGITLNEIFKYEQIGLDTTMITGHHISTGSKPEFDNEIKIPAEYFHKTKNHTYSPPLDKAKKSSIKTKLSRKNPN